MIKRGCKAASKEADRREDRKEYTDTLFWPSFSLRPRKEAFGLTTKQVETPESNRACEAQPTELPTHKTPLSVMPNAQIKPTARFLRGSA